MVDRKQKNSDKRLLASAQVILRSATGKSVRGQEPITSQNIQDFMPSAETVSTVTKAFAEAAFDVGHAVGNSFSISAPVETFESVFGTRLQRDKRGGLKSVGPNGESSLELPLQRLPKVISDNVESITFTSPPDFGPTGSGP